MDVIKTYRFTKEEKMYPLLMDVLKPKAENGPLEVGDIVMPEAGPLHEQIAKYLAAKSTHAVYPIDYLVYLGDKFKGTKNEHIKFEMRMIYIRQA